MSNSPWFTHFLVQNERLQNDPFISQLLHMGYLMDVSPQTRRDRVGDLDMQAVVHVMEHYSDGHPSEWLSAGPLTTMPYMVFVFRSLDNTWWILPPKTPVKDIRLLEIAA